MQIMAICPGCHHVWMLDSDAADKRITCEQCGRLFKIPRPEELAKAAKIVKGAKGVVYVDKNGKIYG